MEDNQMTLNATDFENQVVDLVKAAMSGDEEANDVIVQIIEAAKKGDEQALKVVALIKQLTQSTSDQAEEGTEEENTEVMKCGGKVRAKMKAKKSAEKKEEGGEIPEEKCGGTAKKMRKVACKAKKCEEGDKLTDTQKFLLGAKCGGKMKKTKKHEEGGLISLDFSQIDFAKCGKKLKKKEDGGEIAEEKCGGKAKKVKKGEVGVRLPEGAHERIWSKSTSTVFSKGGKQCPCALKRIGGKIVNVDTCTGLPIAKQGIKLILKGDNGIPKGILRKGNYYTLNADGPRNTLTTWYRNPDGTWRAKGAFGSITKLTDDIKSLLDNAYDYYVNFGGDGKSAYKDNGDGTFSRFGSTKVYRKMKADNGKMYYTTGGDQATWDDENQTWVRDGYTFNLYDNGKGEYVYRWNKNETSRLPERETSRDTERETFRLTEREAPRVNMFANSGLQDISLSGRQQWVRNNADYLKQNGWTDARIASYRGSAQDNRDLLAAIKNKSAWDNSHNSVQEEPVVYTNQDLMNMSVMDVVKLNDKDLLNRRLDLQRAVDYNNDANTYNNNIRRAHSTFNGQNFMNADGSVDVNGYNKAVENYNWNNYTNGAANRLGEENGFGTLKLNRFNTSALILFNDANYRKAVANGLGEQYIRGAYKGADKVRMLRLHNNSSNYFANGQNTADSYTDPMLKQTKNIDMNASDFKFKFGGLL